MPVTRAIADMIAGQGVITPSYTIQNGQIILTTGTITTSKPAVSATQTWNDAGVAFVADTMNITDTASAATSLLWERKINAQRKHQFTKTGLEIFNSWTSDSVYERGFFRWVSDVLQIGTEHVGANLRNINFVGGNVGVNAPSPLAQLHVSTDGIAADRGIAVDQHNTGVQAAVLSFRKSRNTFASPGTVVNGDYVSAFIFQSHDGSAYRSNAGIFARTNGTIAANSVPTDIAFWTSAASEADPATNGKVRMTINSAGNVVINTGLLHFLGSTSSFPALKRSTTILQARLADDSAFATLQGKLQTDAAYAAGDPTTTGYIILYDSTGTAYRIPALLHS